MTKNEETRMTDTQVMANYESYIANYRDELERDHMGKVVLLHDGEIVDVFDEYDDAYWRGVDDYELGNFSIQKIGDQPAQLGVFAYALQHST